MFFSVTIDGRRVRIPLSEASVVESIGDEVLIHFARSLPISGASDYDELGAKTVTLVGDEAREFLAAIDGIARHINPPEGDQS